MINSRILLILLLFILPIVSHASEEKESVGPTFNVKLERPVSRALIEGEPYFNVSVELDASSPSFCPSVKVTVKDEKTGKKIYKKRFSNSYLYAFSDGTIQIGKGKAITQLILTKVYDNWLVEIREKGIY